MFTSTISRFRFLKSKKKPAPKLFGAGLNLFQFSLTTRTAGQQNHQQQHQQQVHARNQGNGSQAA